LCLLELDFSFSLSISWLRALSTFQISQEGWNEFSLQETLLALAIYNPGSVVQWWSHIQAICEGQGKLESFSTVAYMCALEHLE
jgi:hypothetical protein